MIDKQLVLCEAQDITCNAASTVVGETVVYIPAVNDHTGAALADPKFLNGSNYLNIVVEGTALLAAVDGSAVTIALYNDTDSTPTTGGDVIFTKTVTANTATAQPAGTVIACAGLPLTTLKPYFGILVSVATQNLSAGKITAWIGPPVTLT